VDTGREPEAGFTAEDGSAVDPPDAVDWRSLVDGLPDILFIVDAMGGLRYANAASGRILGRDAASLVGTSALDLVHPDDRGHAIESLGETTAKGPGIREPTALRVVATDGSVHVLEIVGTNRLEDPLVGGIVITGRDVTQHDVVEASLSNEGRRFESAFDHSPGARVLIATDGRIMRANPAAAALTGHPSEVLVNLRAPDLRIGDEADLDRHDMELLLAGTIDHVDFERLLRHADGHELWTRGTVSLVRDGDGEPQYLSVEFHDVTALREQEQLRERAETQLRVLLDSTGEIITVLEPDGTWRATFGALHRMFGYDPAASPGEVGGVLSIVHPDDHDAAFVGFAKLAAADADPDEAFTVRVLAADGSIRWTEVRVRNLVDDPAVNGYVLLSRDVTELREAQQLLAHQASHDPLTMLPNRSYFQEIGEQALARADRSGMTVAVLFLDIDRFKRVNDSYGHPVGDALLRETADRLREAVRRGDVVARFGGDEFVVLCEHPAGRPEMLDLATRLLAKISRPVELPRGTVQIGVSIGIAIGGGGNVTIDTLLRDADVALYQAKDRGRGRAVVFGLDGAA
jgi:diguanylate cyclase (GGDEF)-like protein/PAS domain S-box-containing protein